MKTTFCKTHYSLPNNIKHIAKTYFYNFFLLKKNAIACAPTRIYSFNKNESLKNEYFILIAKHLPKKSLVILLYSDRSLIRQKL